MTRISDLSHTIPTVLRLLITVRYHGETSKDVSPNCSLCNESFDSSSCRFVFETNSTDIQRELPEEERHAVPTKQFAGPDAIYLILLYWTWRPDPAKVMIRLFGGHLLRVLGKIIGITWGTTTPWIMNIFSLFTRCFVPGRTKWNKNFIYLYIGVFGRFINFVSISKARGLHKHEAWCSLARPFRRHWQHGR